MNRIFAGLLAATIGLAGLAETPARASEPVTCTFALCRSLTPGKHTRYVFSDSCAAMASICSRVRVPGMYLLPQSIIADNTGRRSRPFFVR